MKETYAKMYAKMYSNLSNSVSQNLSVNNSVVTLEQKVLGDLKIKQEFVRKIFMFFQLLPEIPRDLTGIK